MGRKSIHLLLLLVLPFMGYSQYVPEQDSIDGIDTNQVVLVELRSGGELIGRIVSQDMNGISLKTENFGLVKIKWKDVSSITDIDLDKVSSKGEYFEDNLQSTRYFFGPNGIGLKKGEGYYQNVWIFFNQATYGFTDYFSLSAGIVPLFFFGGTPSPIWIVPKVSVTLKEDLFHVGGGALLGGWAGDNMRTFGVGFGSFTLGNLNNNLSLSLGYGMVEGEWSNKPVVSISGLARLNTRLYILSENYLFPNDIFILSFGLRSILRKSKVGIDYGLLIPGGAGNIVLPWLGLTVPF